MRTHATILSLAIALWGGGAAAQAPAEGGPIVELPPESEEEGLDTSELDALASDPSLRDFGGAVDAEDLQDLGELEIEAGGQSNEHQVVEGDTLWDVSHRYLGSPWLWPKVWSMNPQVENPHWIYPGDRIRVGEDEAPHMGSEMDPFDYGPEEDELPAVSVARRIAVQPPQGRLTTIGFVTDREVEDAAVVAKSWEEKLVLGEGDRLYLDWPKRDHLQPGSLFLVYRTDRRIASLGYLTRILGMVRIVDTGQDARYVTAVIERSMVEIERGDRVGPMRDLGRMVERRPNRVELTARIGGALEQGMVDFGQGHIVFVNKGRRDGVEVGNTFEVIRASDGLDDDGYTPRYDRNMPRERIGEMLVVDVQEGASAALIVSSVREFRIGDRAEMRIQPSTASR